MKQQRKIMKIASTPEMNYRAETLLKEQFYVSSMHCNRNLDGSRRHLLWWVGCAGHKERCWSRKGKREIAGQPKALVRK
jgi:hypothetical protein